LFPRQRNGRSRPDRSHRRFVVWINRTGALRLAALAGLLALAAVMLLADVPSVRTWSYWTLPLTGKVIALDAGHGGPDGGASSREGVIEKDINLAIVLYLRDYLQQAGALVTLTREGDYDLAAPETKGYSRRKTEDLKKRVEQIRGKKADLAVSIHLNSIPSAKWSGAQTFYAGQHPDSPRLAAVIQDEIRNSLGNTNRVALRKDTVYLIRQLDLPSALVEVGFLSNPGEARLLADEQYQKKVAAAIYRGILRFSSGERVQQGS